MFRCVESLSPCKTCLSVADFDDTLLEIQSILKKVENSPKHADNKQAMLERAFKLGTNCLHSKKGDPDKQLALLFSEILRQYASLCYEDNIFIAKQILLASLGLHLYGIDVLNASIDMRDFYSLDNLRSLSETRPLIFSALEQSILTMNADACMIRAYKSSFIQPDSQKNLFHLAEAVRWLGHCYQSLASDHAESISSLLRLSESLLLLADDERSRHALADLYVRARQYITPQPTNADELGHFYDICLRYDSSAYMQARVAHQHFCALSAHGYQNEALPHIYAAMNIASKLEEGDEKLALLADFCDHYAYYLMNPNTLDLPLASQLFKTSTPYATQCRSEGRDLFTFALYDMHAAQFKLLTGELQEAKNLIESALATLHKYPHQNSTLLIQADALKSLIHKTTVE